MEWAKGFNTGNRGGTNPLTAIGGTRVNHLEECSIPQLNLVYEYLKALKLDRTINALDYAEWEKYEQQNRIRVDIIKRTRSKSGTPIFAVLGGNRSGKTELGAGVVAHLFGELENARIWCATISEASVSVQQSKLAKLIRQSDIAYGEYNPIRGWKNSMIISKKGTVIRFKTYEQGRETYQGEELDFIWSDEEMPWSIYQECVARLTDRQGTFLLTFTSLMGYTRLVNYLWLSETDQVYRAKLKLEWNPFIPEAGKKQFMSLIDQDEWEARIEGNISSKQGLVYKEFDPSKHTIKQSQFDWRRALQMSPTRYHLSEGIDPHERTPHHWLRFVYDEQEDVVYIVDELKAPVESMVISDFAELIKEKREGFVPEYCQIDTSSMKPDVITKRNTEHQDDVHSIRSEFFKHGISTVLCSKNNALGIGLVKDRLKTVRRVNDVVMSGAKLYVMDNCTGILGEFKLYSWQSYISDTVGERNEMPNQPMKKNDHFMDIMKYECIKRNRSGKTELQTYTEQEMYTEMGY